MKKLLIAAIFVGFALAFSSCASKPEVVVQEPVAEAETEVQEDVEVEVIEEVAE